MGLCLAYGDTRLAGSGDASLDFGNNAMGSTKRNAIPVARLLRGGPRVVETGDGLAG